MKKWVEELQANGPKDIVLAVVGNKIDRCDEEEVDYASVKEYATSLGAILKLVSAKEGKNIDVTLPARRTSSTPWAKWQSRSAPRRAGSRPRGARR
jgi:GTPase SAR1 family protein